VCGAKGERARTSAGVSDEVEPLKARLVGKAPDPLDLGLESPRCRRLAACVQLELLRMGVHLGSEGTHEIRVGELRRDDAAGQEDRVKPSAFPHWLDRKSTRLNSSHVKISYAVFCL